jgi:hypothetical protein
MQKLVKSRLALAGRLFMSALFVGTLWMTSAGCWDHDHDDRWHHDHDNMDQHDDHDHASYDHPY